MQKSSPGVPNFVMAYNFVVNYGYYYQWPCPALDTPATMRDNELFDNQLTTFGMPMSDTQFQIIDRENKQRFLELMFDPERIMWTLQNMGVGSSAANSAAGVAQSSLGTAINRVTQADGAGAGGDSGAGIFGNGGQAGLGALINIANENSGVYTASDNPDKSIPQAVWMVQQMYKFVFVPMAILFLLPGAVVTQVKGQVAYAFKINQDDNSSPFEGIFRSLIAVFLIPATQLIVSYAIDVGNSMSYSVADYVQTQVIEDWAQQLLYNNQPGNVDNAILPAQPAANAGAANGTNGGFLTGVGTSMGVSQSTMSAVMGAIGQLPGLGQLFADLNNFLNQNFGTGGGGLGDQQPDSQAINERELWLSQILQLVFNVANYLFSLAVLILTAFQLVYMCYLFLLGPLAAALFAWPKTSQNLFRDIFANWCNAVIVCSLWRFYWMVILAIMTQRIIYLMDTGATINLQWEVAVFTCFMGIMLYVPFNPWSFDPAVAFDMMAAGQSALQQAGGAMGSALQAAGVPQSTINQMGNQFNSALGNMQPFISNNAAANSYSQTGYQNNYNTGLQQTPGSQGTGAPTGAQQTGGGGTQPPPTQSQAPALPQTSAPVVQPPPVATAGPAQATPQATPQSAPPSASNPNEAANTSAVANAAPEGVQVANTGSPTVAPSAPHNSPTLSPNPNVSPSEAQAGTQSLVASHGVGQTSPEPPAAGGQTEVASAAPAPPPSPSTEGSSVLASAAVVASEANPTQSPANPANAMKDPPDANGGTMA